MMPAEELRREILRRYNRDPHEWHVLAGRDQKGYYDVVVVHGSDTWLIKEQMINPLYSVGFGVKDNLIDQPFGKTQLPHYTFGLRPLSRQHVENVTNALKTGQNLTGLISNILKTTPVASNEIESHMALQGPIIHGSRAIHAISENQAELDRKLRIELEKLLYRRYSNTVAPYL